MGGHVLCEFGYRVDGCLEVGEGVSGVNGAGNEEVPRVEAYGPTRDADQKV
jgi:hypothetical protein